MTNPREMGSLKPRQNRDIPNYRTLTHTRTFLIFLFLLICALLTALEYALHVIPSATDRTAIPKELNPLIPSEDKADDRRTTSTSFTPTLTTSATKHVYGRYHHFPAQPSSTSHVQTPTPTQGGISSRVTTIFYTDLPKATPLPGSNGNIRGRFAPDPSPEPRLSSELYANIGTIRTHFTWGDYWAPHPTEKDNKVPVSRDQAVKDDLCVYLYKGVATTRNESACAGEITIEIPPRARVRDVYDPYPGPISFDKPECMVAYVKWVTDNTFCQTWKPGCTFFTIRNCWKLAWDTRDVGDKIPDGAPTLTWAEPEKKPDDVWPIVFKSHKDLQLFYYRHTLKEEFLESNGIFSPSYRSYMSEMQEKASKSRAMAGSSASAPSSSLPPFPIFPRWYDEFENCFYQQLRGGGDAQILRKYGAITDLVNPDRWLESYLGNISGSLTTSSTSNNHQSNSPSPSPPPSTIVPVQFSQTFWTTTRVSIGLWTHTSVLSWTELDGTPRTSTRSLELPIMSEQKSAASSAAVVAFVPVVWKTASPTTKTNEKGQPITTETEFGGVPLAHLATTTEVTSTWEDASGVKHTSVGTVSILGPPVTSRVVTLGDASGIPTATVTEYPVLPSGVPGPGSAGSGSTILRLALARDYFAIFFLPVVLSAIVSVPVQMLDSEIRLQMPFRGLTRSSGSLGCDSMCVRTRGWKARRDEMRMLWRCRDFVPAASYLLLVVTTALVSIASETVGVKLRGSCSKTDAGACLLTVATFAGPARAAEALLVVMLLLVVLIGVSLWRWRNGLATHPGSVAAVCALLQNQEAAKFLRSVRLDEGGQGYRKLAAQLGSRRFALAWDPRGPRAEKYGLVLVEDSQGTGDVEMAMAAAFQHQHSLLPSRLGAVVVRRRIHNHSHLDDDDAYSRHSHESAIHLLPRVSSGAGNEASPAAGKKSRHPPRLRISLPTFLFFHLGLLTLILYYEMTVYGDPEDSPFEAFMDSQTFGVRMLFSTLGSLLAVFWEGLFGDVAAQDPFRRMSHGPVQASVLLEAPPTSAILGIWYGVRRGRAGVGSVGLAGVVNKLFAPVLLSNIPYQVTQTWVAHEVCVWLSVGVLAYSSLVLVWCIFLSSRGRGLGLPVGLDTLAGRMYYVCDSFMLADFARVSMLEKTERDQRVVGMGHTYSFGSMVGVSGQRRVGVDWESRVGGGEQT